MSNRVSLVTALLLGTCLLLAFSPSASAQGSPPAATDENILSIRVTPGGAPLFPVAIPDLINKGEARHAALGMEGALILSHDLDYSFYFRILSPSLFLRTPTSTRIPSGEFPAWSAIGADALIAGEYFVDSRNMVEVTLRLYDVSQRRALVAKRYRGNVSEWRRIMHRFADETLRAITGVRGPFYSRIVFASNQTGAKEIYIADPDGKRLRQVTTNRSINLSPAFSPTGGALIFTTYAAGAPSYPSHVSRLYFRRL